MKYITPFLFLIVSPLAYAGSVTGTTCDEQPVADWLALSSTVAGDTYTLPAGTCTWTFQLNVTKPVTIRGQTWMNWTDGAARTNLVPQANAAEQTIIKDEVVNANGGRPSIINVNINTASYPHMTDPPSSGTTQVVRISGLHFQPSTAACCATTSTGAEGWVYFNSSGSARNYGFRLDNCWFDNVNAGKPFGIHGWTCGVVDHCRWDIKGGQNIFADEEQYGGANKKDGNGAYADYPWFGTDRFFFIEDCYFRQLGTNAAGNATDNNRGGHFVGRYCYLVDTIWGTHGQEGQSPRGNRAYEIYNCKFNGVTRPPANGNARSGVPIFHDNTWTGVVTGGGTSHTALNVYRLDSARGHPIWLGSDGRSPWDINAAQDGTPVALGQPGYRFYPPPASPASSATCTTTATPVQGNSKAYIFTDSNANWTPGQWINYSVVDTNPNSTTGGSGGRTCRNFTANLTGSTVITSSDANFNSANDVGDIVKGTNIPANDKIVSIQSSTQATLASPTTGGTVNGAALTMCEGSYNFWGNIIDNARTTITYAYYGAPDGSQLVIGNGDTYEIHKVLATFGAPTWGKGEEITTDSKNANPAWVVNYPNTVKWPNVNLEPAVGWNNVRSGTQLGWLIGDGGQFIEGNPSLSAINDTYLGSLPTCTGRSDAGPCLGSYYTLNPGNPASASAISGATALAAMQKIYSAARNGVVYGQDGNGNTNSAADGTYKYPHPLVTTQGGGGPPPPPPADPTNLAAAATSSSVIHLTWNDNANNEEGYEIQRATSASGTFTALSPDASADSTSYDDTGLTANKQYFYKIRAFNYFKSQFSNFAPSSGSVSATTLGGVASVTISPNGGNFSGSRSVSLSCTTPSSTIHYTLDGTTPTATHGTTYSVAFTLSTDTTVKAMATASGLSDGPVSTASFTFTSGQAPDVTISPNGGTITGPTSVTISCTDNTATIKYTLDGTDPTSSSSTYSSSLTISTTTTLKARAIKSGLTDGNISTATFTLSSVVTPPTIINVSP